MGKSRKLIKGVNDLATVRHNLVNEWDYDKNEHRIDEYTYGSRQFVYWKCKYGHRWKAMIYERYRGTGCPYVMENLVHHILNNYYMLV